MKILRHILPILALLALPAVAQVPQLISYQGRVAVNNVNFDGTGQFKFALVNAAGSTAYWRNSADTTPADGVPDNAVSLPVSKGLYSVLLGDATLANMAVVPNTVFNNGDVHLRVWFNDGVNGFQLLTPDQRMTAVGYALMAASVPDGSITSQKIADGNVTGTKIAAGAVDSSHLSVGVQGSFIPAGVVVAYAGNTPPSGWLMCDGQSISRTTFAALFGVIGTSHGAVDGNSFNLPDYRGRFLRGVDGGTGRDPDASTRTAMNTGGNTGSAVGSVQADEIKAHSHSNGIVGGSVITLGGPTGLTLGQTGVTGGNETRPKNAAVNYIIKS